MTQTIKKLLQDKQCVEKKVSPSVIVKMENRAIEFMGFYAFKVYSLESIQSFKVGPWVTCLTISCIYLEP